MAQIGPMIVAETLTLAVVEILRLFSERGLAKTKLDELQEKLLSAGKADQNALETFIRTELASQIVSFRAESAARHEALRRDVRRWVLTLGVAAIVIAAGSAALASWLVRAG